MYLIFPKQNVTKICLWRCNIIWKKIIRNECNKSLSHCRKSSSLVLGSVGPIGSRSRIEQIPIKWLFLLKFGETFICIKWLTDVHEKVCLFSCQKQQKTTQIPNNEFWYLKSSRGNSWAISIVTRKFQLRLLMRAPNLLTGKSIKMNQW